LYYLYFTYDPSKDAQFTVGGFHTESVFTTESSQRESYAMKKCFADGVINQPIAKSTEKQGCTNEATTHFFVCLIN
jgi:hypothetical protein